MEIDRGNILAAAQYVTHELLDFVSANQLNCVDYDEGNNGLTDISSIVSRLLVIIERGICHGLPPLLQNPHSQAQPNRHIDPWPIICHMSSVSQNLLDNVELIQDVHTGLGKTRLWIRFALMGKESLLVSNEGVKFARLLCGLGILDFCFGLKDNLQKLDRPLGLIDFRPCIQPPSKASERLQPSSQSEIEERLFKAIEQNSYLEEASTTAQLRVEKLLLSNKSLKDTVVDLESQKKISETEKVELEAQIAKVESENRRLSTLLVRQSKEVQNDLAAVRATFKHSTSSMDSQITDLEKRLDEETGRHKKTEDLLQQEIVAKNALKANLNEANTQLNERQRLLEDLRRDSDGRTVVNIEMSAKNRNLTAELADSKKRVDELKEKIISISSIMNTLDERCTQLRAENSSMEASLIEATQRANKSESRCLELQTDLQVCQEAYQTLQGEFDEASSDLANISALQENIDRKSQMLRERDVQITELQHEVRGQEASLLEMASQLATTKLLAEDLAQRLKLLQDAQWKGDEEVKACTQCAVPFSVTRRKHHCRNCGLIFCYECSAFKMALPSSAKPVRVCEICHNRLLERYSASKR